MADTAFAMQRGCLDGFLHLVRLLSFIRFSKHVYEAVQAVSVPKQTMQFPGGDGDMYAKGATADCPRREHAAHMQDSSQPLASE